MKIRGIVLDVGSEEVSECYRFIILTDTEWKEVTRLLSLHYENKYSKHPTQTILVLRNLISNLS